MLVKLSESKDSGSNMLKEANMAIVVLGNPEISDLWSDDSSIVSFAIQLKAFDLGIGSCWVNLKGRESKYGISSEEYMEKNILKLKARYPHKFENNLALNRNLEVERSILEA